MPQRVNRGGNSNKRYRGFKQQQPNTTTDEQALALYRKLQANLGSIPSLCKKLIRFNAHLNDLFAHNKKFDSWPKSPIDLKNDPDLSLSVLANSICETILIGSREDQKKPLEQKKYVPNAEELSMLLYALSWWGTNIKDNKSNKLALEYLVNQVKEIDYFIPEQWHKTLISLSTWKIKQHPDFEKDPFLPCWKLDLQTRPFCTAIDYLINGIQTEISNQHSRFRAEIDLHKISTVLTALSRLDWPNQYIEIRKSLFKKIIELSEDDHARLNLWDISNIFRSSKNIIQNLTIDDIEQYYNVSERLINQIILQEKDLILTQIAYLLAPLARWKVAVRERFNASQEQAFIELYDQLIDACLNQINLLIKTDKHLLHNSILILNTLSQYDDIQKDFYRATAAKLFDCIITNINTLNSHEVIITLRILIKGHTAEAFKKKPLLKNILDHLLQHINRHPFVTMNMNNFSKLLDALSNVYPTIPENKKDLPFIVINKLLATLIQKIRTSDQPVSINATTRIAYALLMWFGDQHLDYVSIIQTLIKRTKVPEKYLSFNELTHMLNILAHTQSLKNNQPKECIVITQRLLAQLLINKSTIKQANPGELQYITRLLKSLEKLDIYSNRTLYFQNNTEEEYAKLRYNLSEKNFRESLCS